MCLEFVVDLRDVGLLYHLRLMIKRSEFLGLNCVRLAIMLYCNPGEKRVEFIGEINTGCLEAG